jgi:hypothetical protein
VVVLPDGGRRLPDVARNPAPKPARQAAVSIPKPVAAPVPEASAVVHPAASAGRVSTSNVTNAAAAGAATILF